MITEYVSTYALNDIVDIDIPRSSSKPVVKAEQLKPGTRAARRQEAREKKRKWAVRYREVRNED